MFLVSSQGEACSDPNNPNLYLHFDRRGIVENSMLQRLVDKIIANSVRSDDSIGPRQPHRPDRCTCFAAPAPSRGLLPTSPPHPKSRSDTVDIVERVYMIDDRTEGRSLSKRRLRTFWRLAISNQHWLILDEYFRQYSVVPHEFAANLYLSPTSPLVQPNAGRRLSCRDSASPFERLRICSVCASRDCRDSLPISTN